MGVMSAPTLGTIFQAGLANYLRTNTLPYFLYVAAQAIRVCRTAALGGHTRTCPQGHVEKAWYNSCGHRACPQCAFLKIEQWLERKREMLLPVDHFHFTFTLPSELYVLWRYNYALMANALFLSVRDTLMKLLADPLWLGATPGILMNLHTWSRAVALNPHVHVLITAGGLAPDGTWAKPRKYKSLLSIDAVKPIFKAKFLDRCEALIKGGKLNLPPDMTLNDALWEHQCAVMKDPWIVDRRPRYEHGHGVVLYLARYVRGGPIKNSRILDFDGETVTFRKSRRGEPIENVKIQINKFIQRILLHVPPIGFRVVRTYGLYAPTSSQKRERCRQLLGGATLGREEKGLAEEIPRGAPEEKIEDLYCRVCGLELEKKQIPRRSVYLAAKVANPRRLSSPRGPPPGVAEEAS